MPNSPVLTPAESDFVHHYCYEVLTGVQTGSKEMEPASRWLRDNNIFPTTIQPFQYAEQRDNDDYISWITDSPLPPFKPAWSSREEFEGRAAQILEIYREMKSLGSALPGYHPTRTTTFEKVTS
jgi:hypothetical protein